MQPFDQLKVYFYCYPLGPAEHAGYEHQLIALAEGLMALGIQPLGNVNYWLKSPNSDDYLIKAHQPEDLNAFDLVIFSSTFYGYHRTDLLPDDLFSTERSYQLIFVDSSDGLMTPGYQESFRAVDLVLKTHYCNRYTQPDNFVPWQFGLTMRVLDYARPLPYAQRKSQLLSNFRVGHQLRGMVERLAQAHFYPLYPQNAQRDSFEDKPASATDKLYWYQTGRRHYPAYYKRLGEHLLVNATGGYLQNKWNAKPGLLHRAIGKLGAKLGVLPYDRVFQFDSPRFWESLAAGCCILHIDFEQFGLQLPVMPENGIHYIGIDLQQPEKTVNLLKDKALVEQIAKQGRDWALKWYSPEVIALRLLSKLGFSKDKR